MDGFFGFPAWHEYLNKVDNVPQINNINDFWLIAAAGLEIIIRLGALVAVGYFIYAGMILMTSQGSSERIAAGRIGMLKATVGLVIMLFSANLVALVAGAFYQEGEQGGIPIVNANSSTLQTVLQYIFVIAGSLSALMIIIGGIRYVVSTGNPQQTSAARSSIIYAVIGLFISISAFVIVNFIFGAAGGEVITFTRVAGVL